MVVYKFLFAVVGLDAHAQLLDVSVGAQEAVASSWARNTALTIFEDTLALSWS
jgi:hypothetical protein